MTDTESENSNNETVRSFQAVTRPQSCRNNPGITQNTSLFASILVTTSGNPGLSFYYIAHAPI